MRGDITRLTIPAIKNYLPSSVNPDARDWMEHGLVAGQISDASLVLQGDLDEFPFNDSPGAGDFRIAGRYRSEEHTSELQSLMRNSYAVLCLKKKKQNTVYTTQDKNAQNKQIKQQT